MYIYMYTHIHFVSVIIIFKVLEVMNLRKTWVEGHESSLRARQRKEMI